MGAVVWLNAVKNAGSMDHLVDFPESNSLRKPFLGLVILLVKALALLPAFLLVVPGDMTVKLSGE